LFKLIGQVVSEENVSEKVNDDGRQMPSDGNSSHDTKSQLILK
jgi:hypothetical protein